MAIREAHLAVPSSFVRMKSIVFTAEGSLNSLATKAGLQRAEIGRLAHLVRHERFDDYCGHVGVLGIGLIAKAPHAPDWVSLSIPTGRFDLPGGTTLSTLVQQACVTTPDVRLVPRSVRKRMERGVLPPIWKSLIAILFACGGELWALGGNGASRPLELHPVGRHHIPVSRNKNRVRRATVTASPPGRLQIPKGTLFALYRDHGYSIRRMASIAGVSAERVRQILLIYGVSLAERRRQQRIYACRLPSSGQSFA
jgi:hypothetical protein